MPRALSPLSLLSLLLLLLPTVSPSPAKEWRTNWREKETRNIDDDDDKQDNDWWRPKKVCSLSNGGSVTEGTDLVIKSHESNCTMKRCLKNGEILSIDVQCHALPCVDPHPKPGACCKYCKEVNCRLPNGKLIKGEDSVRYGNKLCRCPTTHGRGQKTRPAWGEVNLTVAECYTITTPAPTTTTPVPHCRLPERGEERRRKEEEEEEEEEEDTSNGLLEPGKERIVPKGDECRKYVCDVRGQLTTYFSQCPKLNCREGNATRRQGACCKTCPGDPEVTSDLANYTQSLPVTHPKKIFAIHIINFLRLLFGNNIFGQKTHHKQHHHHHHHHRHHSHHHPRNTLAGSDVKSGKGTTGNDAVAKKENGGDSDKKLEAGKGANSKKGKKQGFFMIFRFGGGAGGGKRWGGGRHHMKGHHPWGHHNRGHGGRWGRHHWG